MKNFEILEHSNILIVDDVPENLDVLIAYLEQYNLFISVALNGEKAIELTKKSPPDIILLDVMMPGIDGFETCSRLKAHESTKDIAVIFMTALSDTIDKVRGFEVGGVDYITKPLQHEEVLARIRTHLTICRQQKELEEQNKKLMQMAEEMKHLASIDPLTQIFNRRYFLEELHREKARFQREKHPFSIIMADIDYFKFINDKYGHDCGDFILTSVVNTIKQNIRKEDIIARWGGEEFIILLPNTNTVGGIETAEKIRDTIETESYIYKELTIKVTITLGVSTYLQEASLDDFIKKSDDALYKGKKQGRNRVIEDN